ncbi:MAG TPA: hypothetical protein VE891_02120 [Allosphingosinicella sp.]|nr:hypothetical protein [Allosphingosinicella sp.]
MRKLIIAVTALAAASPAFAQPGYDGPGYDQPGYDRPGYDPRGDDVVRRLPPPSEVERIGDQLGRATEALMDVDIGPVVDALDPYGRRYRQGPETLGDLAGGRRDPYARERIRGQIGAVTVGLGAAVEQMAVMTPILRRSLQDATRRMEDAIARGRAARPYERDDRYYDRRDDERYDRDHDPRDYDPEHEPR